MPVLRPDAVSSYPGLHMVKLVTEAAMSSCSGSPDRGVLSLPGQPDRRVALARRTVPRLLWRLSRLSGDEAFDHLMAFMATEEQS